LELRARGHTGAAIRALLGLAPKTAGLVRDGQEEYIPIEPVQPNDLSHVHPGEKIPAEKTTGSAVIGRPSTGPAW
jgi:cation transport ATPase